jgi:hypothetical protein
MMVMMMMMRAVRLVGLALREVDDGGGHSCMGAGGNTAEREKERIEMPTGIFLDR